MAGAFAGFEPEWLDRRIVFLLDRAEVHLTSDDLRSRACGATLYRDAAAIALMRDDMGAGRKYLRIAAEHFIRLGLPHGALLMMLAGGKEGAEPLLAMLDSVGEKGQAQRSDRSNAGPMFAASLHQPEQLLALQTSIALAEAAGIPLGHGEATRFMLRPFRAHPVGPSGVSVETFMRLMNAGMAGRRQAPGAAPQLQPDMAMLVAQRRIQLASAAVDRHHWRLLLSPAALLDFDLVALFAIWWAHGHSPREAMEGMDAEPPPMMMRPVEVAFELRPRSPRTRET